MGNFCVCTQNNQILYDKQSRRCSLLNEIQGYTQFAKRDSGDSSIAKLTRNNTSFIHIEHDSEDSAYRASMPKDISIEDFKFLKALYILMIGELIPCLIAHRKRSIQ